MLELKQDTLEEGAASRSVAEERVTPRRVIVKRDGKVVSPLVFGPLNATHWLLTLAAISFPMSLVTFVATWYPLRDKYAIQLSGTLAEGMTISYPLAGHREAVGWTMMAAFLCMVPWFVLARVLKWLRPTSSLRLRTVLFLFGLTVTGLCLLFDPGSWLELVFVFRKY
jgi:hypothetical protein